MITLLLQLLRLLPFLCGGHRQLALENLALHQQLAVYKRTAPRPKLRTTDRLFWVALARVWAGWRRPLVIVTPDTILRWQRRRFREHWTKLSGRPTRGRPPVNPEIAALVTRMTAGASAPDPRADEPEEHTAADDRDRETDQGEAETLKIRHVEPPFDRGRRAAGSPPRAAPGSPNREFCAGPGPAGGVGSSGTHTRTGGAYQNRFRRRALAERPCGAEEACGMVSDSGRVLGDERRRARP